MIDRRQQAERALRVYLERGSKALASLARGDVDHAAEWLSKREAAFRNFLALEKEAQKIEPSIAATSDWTEMLETASQQNLKLKRRLVEAMAMTQAKVSQLTASSRTIGKFVALARRNQFHSAG
jgi:mevalonate kinase